jgi:porin
MLRSATVRPVQVALLSLALQAANETPAAAPEPPAAPRSSAPNRDPIPKDGSEGILGDLLGVRPSLAGRGITFDGELILDLSGNATGGLRTGFWGQAFLELGLAVDAGKLAGIEGGMFRIEMDAWNKLTHADYPIGDFLYYDGDYPGGEKPLVIIGSLYWRQRLLDDRLEIQFGKADASTNFAFVNGAGDFLSNYGGYVAGVAQYLPNWGNPATGIEVAVRPFERVRWQAAWYDGATNAWDADSGSNGPPTGPRGPATFFDDPGAALLMSELQLEWSLGGARDGLVKGGAWVHLGETGLTGPPDPATGELVTTVIEDAYGYYAVAIQTVWAAGDEGPAVDLFGAISWSDPSRNPVEWGFNAGITARGLIPGRPADSIGLMASPTLFTGDDGITPLGTAYGLPGGTGGSEINVEAYWRMELDPRWVIQPDLQWISTPSGTLEDALVATLRVEIAF